ncbi:MAG TPA: twin-arginine translocase TatA/TatE family subunit [Actinomycetales bacterium]|nr:twin-arginine translocase TatA/TatE family subunit [Actinomycetales bacterium]
MSDPPAMFAGINGSEALILLVIILIVVGPERLPHYAAQLGKLVRGLKAMLSDAQTKVRDELGPEGEDIPWEKLDPRQYDPRRIVREAVFTDDSDGAPTPGAGAARRLGPGATAAGTGVAMGAGAAAATAVRGSKAGAQRDADQPPPFDDEAT